MLQIIYNLSWYLYYIFLLALFREFISFIWNSWINKRKFKWQTNGGQYWAVVTGSTDGIGYEMARQLAIKGYNIMMLSRNDEKLQTKKQLILKECPNVQIKTLAVDFGHADIYDKIEQFLQPNINDIYILVNNVGTTRREPLNFYDDVKRNSNYLMINVMSMVKMTELILPKMIENKRGLILNVSSIMSIFYGEKYATYSATKTFMRSLSLILYRECMSHNVLVFNLIPGFIQTNITKIKMESYAFPSAKNYVIGALDSVSWNNYENTGHFGHTLMKHITNILNFLFGWQAVSYIFVKSVEIAFDKLVDKSE